MIEEDLEKLRLAVPAEALRVRILSAAGAARRDQLVGRWITLSAVAALVIAGFASLQMPFDEAPPTPVEREVVQLAEMIQAPELAPYLQVSSSLGAPPTEEDNPWLQ